MLISLTILFTTLSSIFRSRAALQLENLALRHQIGVLQRSVRKRPKLTPGDRLLWVWLSRIWRDWRSALAIVKPETVLAWHRAGFRLFWAWKVRHVGQPGRPTVPREIRDLIRKVCRKNPGWGAPRVHGELLKLGIDVGKNSVSKYMVHGRKPPSQTWRTFLAYDAQLTQAALPNVRVLRFFDWGFGSRKSPYGIFVRDKALSHINTALAVGIRDAKIFRHAGEIALAAGAPPASERYLRQSAELNALGSEEARVALARLSESPAGRVRP